MASNVFVVGGTGFIGRRLVAACLADGVEVVLGTRRDGPAEADGLTVARLDQLSLDDVSGVLERRGVGVVINLASYGVIPGHRDSAAMFDGNVRLAADMVALAVRTGSILVHAGSSAEYAAPRSSEPLAETAAPEMTKLYGASKLAGSAVVISTAAAAGTSAAVLRLFNIYGPGEADHRLLPSLLRGLAAGGVPLSAGTQVRDFVHVDDAVAAFRLTAEALRAKGSAARTGVWNVATGIGRSVRDFAEAVADHVGADRALLRFGDMPMRPDDVPCLIGDPAQFVSAIGWSPRYALRQGVGQAVREMRGP